MQTENESELAEFNSEDDNQFQNEKTPQNGNKKARLSPETLTDTVVGTKRRATGVYYAVKKSSSVQNCIFFSWKDCKIHVEDRANALFAVFDNLLDAGLYINPKPCHKYIEGKSLEESKFSRNKGLVLDWVQPYHAFNGDNLKGSKKGVTNAPKCAEQVIRKTKEAKVDENYHSDEESESEGSGTSEGTSDSSNTDSEDDYVPVYDLKKVATKKKRIPTCTRRNTQSVEDPDLTKKTSKNGDTSKPKQIRKRNPNKKWLSMYEEIKRYNGAFNTFEIHDKDCNEENLKLYLWLKKQQSEYKHFKEGKKSTMYEEKIKMLEDIGYEFTYKPWIERMEELKGYHAEKGHCGVPVDYPGGLGKWVETQMQRVKLYFGKGGKRSHLTRDQVDHLQKLDFYCPERNAKPKNEGVTRATEERELRWEEMFRQLREYKEENGTCNVLPAENPGLNRWIARQRKNWRKLHNDETGYNPLTREQLGKLTQIGFVFQKRKKDLKWNERLEQLREYVKEYQSTRVPKSGEHINPLIPQGLPAWVQDQRKYYWRMVEGKKTYMTEERVALLAQLGFEFEAGKRRDPSLPKQVFRTWEERFEDLLEFKATHGHTVVPQHFHTGLGYWVQEQRIQFKKLNRGLKSHMSPEKAMKLVNIGFVFDATCRRGSKISKENYRKVGGNPNKHV